MATASKKTVHLILCAFFSALIAIGAFIKIPLPNVPVTLQTLFVLLAGMLLGGKCGAVSVCVYLAVGLIGLPVFTQGGGIMYVLKPTFGYLLGFLPCAYISGALSEKNGKPSIWKLFLSGLLGLCAVYLLGTVYFSLISCFYLGTEIPFIPLLGSCVFFFLPADLLSCALCAFVSKKLLPVIKRHL